MEHKAKILIVDDEPTNVLLLERILAKVPAYQLASTSDSRGVSALVTQFCPDLLLLDLHMPYKDGFSVMQELRPKLPPGDFFPILVLTADVTSQTKLRALASGATDFLTKPFDKSEVLLRVENLLHARWLHKQVQTQNDSLEQMVQQRTAELQLALNKLQETQQQVVQQERLHALGMMASGVAHDFNNALSVILGFGELLLQECAEIPEAKGMASNVQTIITAAMDGAEMVTRLREFYRPDSGNGPKLPIDLNALVEQALSITLPRWKTQALSEGRTIHMITDFADILPVAGDAAELREALTNLIFNAVDAMPKGGRVIFRTRRENDHTILEVTDSGTGMSEEIRRRCLEPFYSTKGKNGTGLGLAMVYGIVERHSGTLEIQSEPGKGTTFRICLPSDTSGGQASDATGGLVERLLNILVVDDQPVLCEIFSEYLKHDWHNVETASGGKEALEKFQAGNFDLVISDLTMPDMTGERLAAEIKTLSPETPVILLTGFSGYHSPETGGIPNVAEVLSKPISLIDLRQAIARVTNGLRRPDPAAT